MKKYLVIAFVLIASGLNGESTDNLAIYESVIRELFDSEDQGDIVKIVMGRGRADNTLPASVETSIQDLGLTILDKSESNSFNHYLVIGTIIYETSGTAIIVADIDGISWICSMEKISDNWAVTELTPFLPSFAEDHDS